VEEVQGWSAAHVSDHSAWGQGSAVLPWKTWGRVEMRSNGTVKTDSWICVVG